MGPHPFGQQQVHLRPFFPCSTAGGSLEQAGPPACWFGVAEGMLAVLGNMLVPVPIPSPLAADPLGPISSLFDLCTLLVIIVFPVFMRIKQAEALLG